MKPKIAYSDMAWAAAFARIKEGQKLSAGATEYEALWKHHDPDWIQFAHRIGNRRYKLLVRKGDALLLELRPA